MTGRDHHSDAPEFEVVVTTDPLSDDLIRGADKIAEFVFGDASYRRQVYHLAQTGTLPIFHLGAILCARKSRILKRIEALEAEAVQSDSMCGK
jgi:hypothetical protein